MKKVVVVIAVLAVAALPSFAQAAPAQNALDGAYLVDYFSNNSGPSGAADQQIRLINYGANGTPLTSPTGDVCANVYVFDANQEMVACCSCRITPNGLLTLSVGAGLTGNPVTSVISANGDIKIVAVDGAPPNVCDATASFFFGEGSNTVVSLKGFATHLQTSGGTAPGVFLTETNIPAADLGFDEAFFLPQACTYLRYLGSGKGVCGCR